MTLKCSLLTLLKIHRPDCEPCKALEKGGIEMRERLEELNSEPYGIFAEVSYRTVRIESRSNHGEPIRFTAAEREERAVMARSGGTSTTSTLGDGPKGF